MRRSLSIGKGSYSLDASIMVGSNVGFGAVAGVKTIKNPISAARAVMNTKDHGTVGCVCLDQKGNIAAATSTGGRGVVLPGHTISDLMEFKGMSAKQAAEEVVFKILPKGSGGLIVVAHNGEVAHPFNGGAMARGAADSTGRLEVGIGKEMRKVK